MEDKTRDVRFPAVYCQTWDKFFVLEHVYRWLQSKGRVLCRIVTNEYWTAKQACINEDRSIDDIYGDPESHLHSLGYNVNSQIGLSKAQRRYILRRIIMNKQMTRAEIESHLSYLIRRNQYNYNFQNYQFYPNNLCSPVKIHYIHSYYFSSSNQSNTFIFFIPSKSASKSSSNVKMYLG